VRDLGTALGETARLHPKRGNIDLFEGEPFITDVDDRGFVRFACQVGFSDPHVTLITRPWPRRTAR